MRKLVSFLLFALPLAAQVCPVTPVVDVNDGKVLHMSFTLASSHTVNAYRVRYDTSTAYTNAYSKRPTVSTRTYMDYNVTALTPSTKYYIDWNLSTDNGATYSTYLDCQANVCPSGAGAQPGGYNCEDIAGTLYPYVDTPAASTSVEYPDSPIHAATFETLPAVTGSTFNATCANLQTQMNNCAAADTSLVHEILLPAATICQPKQETSPLDNYTLPAKLGAGYCIIRCADYADLDFQPQGTVASPDTYSQRCGIQYNDDDNNTERSLIDSPAYSAGHDTQGWIFDRISINLPPHETVAQQTYAITAFNTANGRATLATNHNIANSQDVRIAIPGIQEPAAQTGWRFAQTAALAANEIQFNSGTWTGAYPGTGGYITSSASFPITSCTAALYPECTTSVTHASVNHFSYTLTSIVSTTATLSSSHKLSNNMTVLIAGSTACDGLWVLSNVNQGAGTATIVGAPDCTGGTLMQTQNARIIDLSGVSLDSEGFVVTYPTDTTIKLYKDHTGADVDFTGLTVTGGYAVIDPPAYMYVVDFGNCDRCVIYGSIFHGDKVQRVWDVFSGISSNLAGTAQGSTGVGNYNWSNLTPMYAILDGVSGVANFNQTFPTFNYISMWGRSNTGDDIQLNNNILAGWGGFLWYSDSFSGQPCTEDMTLKRNTHYYAQYRRTGKPEAKGIAYNSRQPIEWKCIDRLNVEANVISQFPAVGVRQVNTITWGVSGDLAYAKGDRNITYRYNAFHKQASALNFTARAIVTNQPLFFATDKVWYADNFISTNFTFGNVGPNGQSMENPGPHIGFEGAFLQWLGNAANVTIERNTYVNRQNTFPLLLRISGSQKGYMNNVNNIFMYNSDAGNQGISCDTGNMDLLPGVTGSGYSTCYTNSLRTNNTADVYSTWDNVVIPGILNPGTTDDWAGANNMYTTAASGLACGGPCPANFSNTIVGADAQSGRDRLDIVFEADRFDPLPAYAGKGVDLDALLNAQGRIRDITALRTSSTIALTVTAPDTNTVCYVDYTDNDKVVGAYTIGDFSNTALVNRVTLPTGSTNRATSLNSLSANTTYYYKAVCGTHIVHGEVTTLP